MFKFIYYLNLNQTFLYLLTYQFLIYTKKQDILNIIINNIQILEMNFKQITQQQIWAIYITDIEKLISKIHF